MVHLKCKTFKFLLISISFLLKHNRPISLFDSMKNNIGTKQLFRRVEATSSAVSYQLYT